MLGYAVISFLAAFLILLAGLERRGLEQKKLRRAAKRHLLRQTMEMHPADRTGRLPEGWI